MIRNCIICGAEIKCSPSDKIITCSKACSIIRKQQSHKGKRNIWSEESRKRKASEGETENLKKGTPAALLSPKSGSFETNVNAQDWILIDPDGNLHYIRNLSLWCKNNAAEIFGRTPHQVKTGLLQIKRSIQGKRSKSPVMHYREWGLKDTWSQKED